MSININIELEQAADNVITYDWLDEDSNLPIDTTGYTAKMQIKKRPGIDIVWLELSTQNGKIVLGGTNGVITVKFVPLDTANVDWGSGIYDLFLTETATSHVTRFVNGIVTIKRNITD